MAVIKDSPMPNDNKDSYATVKMQYRVASVIALLVLTGGAVFYHFVEHFSWVNAFYFCTVTLTTVGYGDLVPKTTAGKVFTIIYILIGISNSCSAAII